MKFRRFLLLLLTGLFAVAGSLAGQPVSDLYDKAEYRVAMRDSTKLYTAVYAPKAASKAPVIIFRTPYGCKPYGLGEYPKNFESGYMRSYIDRGYIVVMQDVRGRYMSEGEFVHIRPAGSGEADETTDSYDTVDWLLKNIPNNNGRVGFAGCSYPGFYAMMGGLSTHPAVKAVSPQAPVTDWFMGDDVHHNGVLMLADSYRFLSGMNTPPDRVPAPVMPAMGRKTLPDEWTFFMEHTTLAELTELQKTNEFWEDLSAHPDYDGWWQERDLRRACHRVRPAVLVVGGLFDAEDGFGPWNLYRALARQSPATASHLVVGPWAHGAWLSDGRKLGPFDFGEQASREYYMEHFEVPFFDHYLKGSGEPETDPLPSVAVFTSGDCRWHTFERWMPRSARKLTFYLADSGQLRTDRPTTKSSSSSYVSDPADPVPYIESFCERRPKEYMVADQRFLSQRADVLTFVSEPLAEDMTFVGPVEAELEVALSTTDADFVVKLIDVFPGDDPAMPEYRMLVRGDVTRGRYRQSFSRPEAFKPGVPARVPIRMPDIAHTFRAGHRVMVQVQSTWFPLAERNPQQMIDLWSCKASDFVTSRISVYHQRSNASSVSVWRLGAE
ncbi:CocE/NonD family hydrolase [uncultured Alistipes sp.]|uniref:CocE/NonD family hydrolase n=1 Tax=uncultured Alistipes sp. TaxID=538949 RepID=UPI0025DAEB14|nr:CocE/NonD family hydrolase [uncultured Alistipes sp.]